ncbi:hypothetical protein [Paracoccus sp. Ld10]|uniref:hypothetical protein n=1 Tax=Paracoccus sp. Ld10 TaxID=649158 RepID=UPI003866BCEF
MTAADTLPVGDVLFVVDGNWQQMTGIMRSQRPVPGLSAFVPIITMTHAMRPSHPNPGKYGTSIRSRIPTWPCGGPAVHPPEPLATTHQDSGKPFHQSAQPLDHGRWCRPDVSGHRVKSGLSAR